MGIFRPNEKKYIEPPTPYAGIVKNPATTKMERAISGPHLLVSGPTGCGKTRRVLGPASLAWGGPAVIVSSKPDILDLTLEARAAKGGPTYLIDLSGEVPDWALPPTVTRCIVDPVALIQSNDDALDMSSLLSQTGAAGASDAGGGSSGGDPFWSTLAMEPLAAILRAAGSDGIGWARRAGRRVAPAGLEEGAEVDPAVPCWVSAIARLEEMGCEDLAEALASAMEKDQRQRDSIMINIQVALAPWARETVRGNKSEIPFTPDLLLHPRATLYMVAPADGVAAGAAVSIADIIAKRWRAGQTEKVAPPRLLMVIDEFCNTMPWQKVTKVVTEARSMGIHLLCAVQATSQFAQRFGDKGMTQLRETFPAILLLVGAPEREMVERAAWWKGKTDKSKNSIDAQGKQSTSTERVDSSEPAELLPKHMGEGRLLKGRASWTPATANCEAGLMVTLPDISQTGLLGAA